MALLERETYEFRPVTVRDATGTVYTGGWHWQVTDRAGRPVGTWLPSVSHAARIGFTVQNLTPGHYLLWVRLDDDDPYLPVPQPTAFTVE